MTLPGGPANKLGNRYEKWWTLSELVRMLGGGTEAIRIEELGVDKAEFVVKTGARRELHQAKRSHPNGKWSLNALRSDGLLSAIGEQLAGNDDRFVFASGSDARELAELCDAARDAESDAEFERHFLKAAERRERFEKLRECWACDVPAAREGLRRVYVRTIDERELRDKVIGGVAALFLANPAAVVAELRGSLKIPCIARFPARISSSNSAGAGFRCATCPTPSMLSPLYKRRQIASWASHGGSSFSGGSSRRRPQKRSCRAWTGLRVTALSPAELVRGKRHASSRPSIVCGNEVCPRSHFVSTASLFIRYRLRRTSGASSVSKNLRPSYLRRRRRPSGVRAF